MKDLVSVLLYLCTFLFGFFLEGIKEIKGKKRTYYINCFVFWLFAFLCFSYMNGADWRGYELDYNSGGLEYKEKDYGYYCLIQVCRFFIKDFWITFALLKCLYLWSCIKLLKVLTPRWVSSLAVMMPTTLLFMLINSPFRFMIAMTCINGAFYFMLKAGCPLVSFGTRRKEPKRMRRTISVKRRFLNYLFVLVLSVLAISFHSAAIFTILFIPFIKFHPFCRINTLVLIALYVLVLVVSSNLNNVLVVQLFVDALFRDSGMRSYNAYFAEETVSFFTLGVLLQFILFLIIVFTRDKVIRERPNGELISNMAILSCFVWRVVAVMPTASRVVHPLFLFYAIYLVYLAKGSRFADFLIACYLCLTMTNSLYESFVYLPYSNSIPYIVTKHRPYTERSEYNLKAYEARTGETIHLLIDDE